MNKHTHGGQPMSVAVLNAPAPAAEEAILAFEAEYHFRLPDDYRSFLKTHTGGQPAPDDTFTFEDDSGPTGGRVNQFFSLGGSGPDSLETCLQGVAGSLPPQALPIGEDDFGNLICLFFEEASSSRASADGSDADEASAAPVVVFWDHEQDDAGEETTFYFLAENFAAFCRQLSRYEPEE
jgi:hypothetical protein